MEDDDDFEVSDHIINDSIFLERPHYKGQVQNNNVFSIGDDQSIKANGVEPHILDYLSQSTYTRPLQF